MKYCSKCGAEAKDDQIYCAICGNELDAPASADAPVKKSNELNIGQLVWAIINIVMCCMPLGVAALILTVMAKDADAEKAAKNLKTAKILNLVGTISAAAFIVIYVIFVIIGMAVGMGMY